MLFGQRAQASEEDWSGLNSRCLPVGADCHLSHDHYKVILFGDDSLLRL